MIKKIVITKDCEDVRPNRSKIHKKGTEITCTKELAEEYIATGNAKYYKEPISLMEKVLGKKKTKKDNKPLLSVDDALKYEEEYGEQDKKE